MDQSIKTVKVWAKNKAAETNIPPKFPSIILNSSRQGCFDTTKLPCDQKIYKNWNQLLDKYKSLSHQYLLLPLKHNYFSQGLCTNTIQVEIFFDNYPHLLTEQIDHRKAKKDPFTEQELWYLLYAYLSTKNYLKDHAEYPQNMIGDIRPENVFINKQRKVKFSSLLSWPNEKINYKKTFDGVTTYLSPQDYELLQLGSVGNQKNKKSELFSIGFTLVSAAILKDNSDVYDIQMQKLDQHEAKKRINMFKCSSTYSELIRAIITSLCAFEVKRRIELDDLWVWIAGYEKRIVQKKPFMVEEIPPQINQQINFLRSQILAIEPSNSVLNLNSIKSLKQSLAKNLASNSQEASNIQIKTLKEVEKGSILEKQFQKSNSRIVINSGIEQKVFYSPINGAYFSSQVKEKSEISQLKSVQGTESKIQTFYSPPYNKFNKGDFNVRKISKSPEGYYSPTGLGSFRVFIQYKSPTRPIEKPFAETVYTGQNQTNLRVAVTKEDKIVEKARKEFDSKSQQSGSYGRHNRLIEETRGPQSNNIISDRKYEAHKKGIKQQKLSPIHRIIGSEQNIAQLMSEVVSEQTILHKDNVRAQHQPSDSVQRAQETNQYQISFKIKQNTQKIDSGIIERVNLRSGKIEQSESKIKEQNSRISSEYFQNSIVLSPVKKQLKKKISLHESKKIHEEISRSKDFKRIEAALNKSDLERHKIEQEIFQLTKDDGNNVVLPTEQAFKSDSINLNVEQRRQIKPLLPQVNTLLRYDQIVAEIFPVQKQSVPRKKTLSQLEIQKHSQMQSQIQKKLTQYEASENILFQQPTENPSNFEAPSNQSNQTHSLHDQKYSQPENQTSEFKENRMQTLNTANQILEVKQIIPAEKPSSEDVQKQNHIYEVLEEGYVEQVSTAQVIENQISFKKQPSNIKNLDQSHRTEQLEIITSKEAVSNNQANILIVDQELADEQLQKTTPAVALNLKSYQPQVNPVHSEMPFISQGSDINQIQKSKQVEQSNEVQIDEQQKINDLKAQNLVQLEPAKQGLEKDEIQVKQDINQQNQIHSQNTQGKLIKQEKILKSPFEQIEQQQSEFHTSHVGSIIPLEQKIIELERDSSKISDSKHEDQLQIATPPITHQFSQNPGENEYIIQQLAQLGLDVNKAINSHQILDCQHDVEPKRSTLSCKIVYNLIEVSQISVAHENLMQLDSVIDGQGRLHSVNYGVNSSQNQASESIPSQQVNQDGAATSEEAYQIKIEPLSKQVAFQQVDAIEQKTQKKTYQHLQTLSNDKFLNEIQEINAKLRQIEADNLATLKKQIQIKHQFPTEQKLTLSDKFKQNSAQSRILVSQQKSQESEIGKGLYVKQQTLQIIDDPFLRDIEETNRKLRALKHQQQFQQTQNIHRADSISDSSHRIEVLTNSNVLQSRSQGQQNRSVGQIQFQQVTNLQANLPKIPTESEFGNISEIMDINKEFANARNDKQPNLLSGTIDPRSQEFFKEFINLNPQLNSQPQFLEKIQMTEQDRDKLADFMKKWQNYNPHQDSSMNQYIQDFRDAITKSQMDNPNLENDHAKIRMTVQDKQTLRMVVENLNANTHKYEQSSEDLKCPLNYDQSSVNVQCSYMKTDTINIANQVKQDNRKQEVIQFESRNIHLPNMQKITEKTQKESNLQSQPFNDLQRYVHQNTAEQTVANQHNYARQQIAEKNHTQKVQQPNTSPSSIRHNRTRPKDLLDEVMQVNKIINREPNKDYSKDNKYLNS